jgi:hypothetical protein
MTLQLMQQVRDGRVNPASSHESPVGSARRGLR